MCLDVDRGTTQQDVEGQQDVCQLPAYPPRHNHHDGRDAHVRTGESRRRTLAHLLRGFYQIEEKAVVESRSGYQVIVLVEIIADRREVAGIHLVHADGGEVELRTCHGQHDIDEIIDEKRGDQHETDFLEPLETFHEIIYHHDEHHRIIEEIAHIERLAEPDGRTELAELYRGLAPEHRLLVTGKDMVEIREKAVELERIGIPVCQEAHLNRHADKCRQAAGESLIQVNKHKRQRHDAQTFEQHRARMVHALVEQQNQDAGQRVIYQADCLYGKQLFPTI